MNRKVCTNLKKNKENKFGFNFFVVYKYAIALEPRQLSRS